MDQFYISILIVCYNILNYYQVDNGTSLIEVKDDGDGISNIDASYMALPSCTSKISSFADLGNIYYYYKKA